MVSKIRSKYPIVLGICRCFTSKKYIYALWLMQVSLITVVMINLQRSIIFTEHEHSTLLQDGTHFFVYLIEPIMY